VQFLGLLIPPLKRAKIPEYGTASSNAYGKLSPLRVLSSAHTRIARVMSKRRNKVCGADVHKDLIVATIWSEGSPLVLEEFGTTLAELERFRDWLISNKCEQVAFEATGVYWIPVNDALSPYIDTIVANPMRIRTIPNEKSDAKDSQWIAELCSNGQIKKSRILSNDDRDLRIMTRARSGYVKTRTQLRNRIHKYLASSGAKLSSCISDIFCKSGRHILNGLVEAKNIDEILDGIPSGRVRKNRDLIKAALGNGIGELHRMLIKDTLDLLDHLESKVEAASLKIFNNVQRKCKDLAIVMSVPGIGFVSGSVILAEIGDHRDFKTPEQLAKWAGLIPGEHESAGKKRQCGITKRGSKYLRTILIEAAQSVALAGKTRLARYFQRLAARKARNVAITALARKLICIIHHLLVNQEMYEEPGYIKRKPKNAKKCRKKECASSSSPKARLEDKVAAIVDAFYHLNADGRKSILKEGCGALLGSEFRPFDGGG
jgi:transposase